MKTRMMLMMVCVLALTSAVFAQGNKGGNGKTENGKGGTAVPAMTVTFDGGNCTATFVRSASGIINETNRVCTNNDAFANAYLQFRPQNGTPNPNCDPDGLLVPQFPFSTSETGLDKYFVSGTTYNVCVYLNQPTQSGSINVTTAQESGDSTYGTNVTLPAAGNYSFCVSGTYDLGDSIIGDAAYLSQYGGEFGKGLATYPQYGPTLGNVEVNGNFVFNGLAYNANHTYCTTITGTKGETLNISVNDPYAVNNQNIDLSYTLRFLHY